MREFGACSNKECPFLHGDPESKTKDRPCYDRGFRKRGPLCRHRHTQRVVCVNFLGFCPEGRSCKFLHPRFGLPTGTTGQQPPIPQQTQPPMQSTPALEQVAGRKCGGTGHQASRGTRGRPAPLSDSDSSWSLESPRALPVGTSAWLLGGVLAGLIPGGHICPVILL